MVLGPATQREEFNLTLISDHMKAWNLGSLFLHVPPPPGSPFGCLHSLGMDLLLFPGHLTILSLEFLPLYLMAGPRSPSLCLPCLPTVQWL